MGGGVEDEDGIEPVRVAWVPAGDGCARWISTPVAERGVDASRDAYWRPSRATSPALSFAVSS